MNKYTFLIGAHKTGTTFFNKLLLENADTLKINNVLFKASNSVQIGLTRYLSSHLSENDLEKTRQYIFSNKEEFTKVVFSHENIAGIIPSFVENKLLYPNIERRINSLQLITENIPIDIVFFIRSYDQFIMSCYSEYIRSKGYITFDKFHTSAFYELPNWVKVIETIQNSYPNANLKIFEHKQVTNNISLLLNEIIGSNSVELNIPESVDGRHSISGTGISVLALMSFFGYKKISNEFVNNLAKLLPKSDEFGGLNELDADEINMYQDLYTIHRDELITRGLLNNG